MGMKQPKEKTAEEAYAALADRCAKAELCPADAQRLLLRWKVAPEEGERIVARLTAEKFLDEERYAMAFVRDKLNFSGWGARKISDALYRKRIPAPVIARAMVQTDPAGMREKLETALRRKMKTVGADGPRQLRDKLIRFGASRGFGLEEVIETVGRLVNDPEED